MGALAPPPSKRVPCPQPRGAAAPSSVWVPRWGPGAVGSDSEAEGGEAMQILPGSLCFCPRRVAAPTRDPHLSPDISGGPSPAARGHPCPASVPQARGLRASRPAPVRPAWSARSARRSDTGTPVRTAAPVVSVGPAGAGSTHHGSDVLGENRLALDVADSLSRPYAEDMARLRLAIGDPETPRTSGGRGRPGPGRCSPAPHRRHCFAAGRSPGGTPASLPPCLLEEGQEVPMATLSRVPAQPSRQCKGVSCSALTLKGFPGQEMPRADCGEGSALSCSHVSRVSGWPSARSKTMVPRNPLLAPPACRGLCLVVVGDQGCPRLTVVVAGSHRRSLQERLHHGHCSWGRRHPCSSGCLIHGTSAEVAPP